ncbi:hypothetical protein DRL71_06750 [Salmonella enterica subsp. enterica serovar Enteritidis]|nr:hypothetical protein [Salmonella enterica subsp. enterica serovar Enteritidis]
MILERVEIVGFRGINRLSLMLEQNNVLIGENAWGKSSLLDALTLLLSPELDLYHFVREDFWFPPGDIKGREHHLHIILTFRETQPGRHRVRRYRALEACWSLCEDDFHRIFYRLEGECGADGSVMTLRLHKDARPLLLVEDPETRLHPIMLSVAWQLLNLLPLQRIATTNSGELLSLTPVEHVVRLVRESSRVAAWRLGPGGLSAEDGRRIAFHIRFNRASSLFARCWLLVEGETETWVINELARQCGHHFDAEGIKVIEFAQSGLKPLVKFARRMGIEWHVLVDGDEAGKKYAATVRSLLNNDREEEREHLTALPALDMEHFMYRQGFADVFHRVAQLPPNVPMNTRKIITKAIHRSSKPDLAIEVAMEAGRRGIDAVPPLFRKMFSRVVWLARGRAD